MRDPNHEDSLGHELVRERQRLEGQQPGLAAGYRSFLQGFSQFREMQKQLNLGTKAEAPRKAALAAGLK